VRPILKAGHPLLLARAAAVADGRAAAALVADLRDTLDSLGGNGIAAPQIGVSLRVLLYAIPRSRLPECDAFPPVPWRALVNPVVEPITAECRPIGLERCLSIPGLHGAVPRPTAIRVRAGTPQGEALDFVARGYHARLIQHEVDHLDGILFPMRMTDLATLGFDDQRPAEAFHVPPGDCPEPLAAARPGAPRG
jgi:peptide deformylase